jgi:hypothetical protein
MAAPDFGPPPKSSFELTPSKEEIALFEENGFLVVDRITTDEEVRWMRRIFEYICSEDFAGKPGSPLDRSGTPLDDGPAARLAQSFFPAMHFPELLNTQGKPSPEFGLHDPTASPVVSSSKRAS